MGLDSETISHNDFFEDADRLSLQSVDACGLLDLRRLGWGERAAANVSESRVTSHGSSSVVVRAAWTGVPADTAGAWLSGCRDPNGWLAHAVRWGDGPIIATAASGVSQCRYVTVSE